MRSGFELIISKPFYMKLHNDVMKKINTILYNKTYHGCYEDFYEIIMLEIQFCEVIANTYEKMVFKIFIINISNPLVKR